MRTECEHCGTKGRPSTFAEGVMVAACGTSWSADAHDLATPACLEIVRLRDEIMELRHAR